MLAQETGQAKTGTVLFQVDDVEAKTLVETQVDTLSEPRDLGTHKAL